jgi:hypothetical protein
VLVIFVVGCITASRVTGYNRAAGFAIGEPAVHAPDWLAVCDVFCQAGDVDRAFL